MIKKQTDVLIVGSGLSGLMVAELLHTQKHVTIITKSEWKCSNSWKAQGGIAAVTSQDDHWTDHFYDTIVAGNFHNEDEMVELLVQQGPVMVQKLIDLGMQFDKDETGQIDLGKEGAHSHRRIMHAGGDQTGKALVQTLMNRLKEHVTITECEMVMDTIVQEGKCLGLWTKDQNGQKTIYEAPYVILASGGAGQLYPITSNDETITGDSYALAYRAGCELCDLEFVQFHPTMLVIDGVCYGLVSEAVRGEGARLVDEEMNVIMEGIHPQKDLAPRDIVARQIYYTYQLGKRVFLDIRSLSGFHKRFPTITSLCKQAGIDLEKGLIPVAPGAHFMMGGICVDRYGRTSIQGLFAIGEAARTGVHGANRLASNSLLECLVFANECARWILNNRANQVTIPKELSFTNEWHKKPTKENLQAMMMKHVGLVRNEKGLQAFLAWLKPYQSTSFGTYKDMDIREQERDNMVTVAYLIASSALMRTESRGGHFRDDFPYENEDFKKRLVMRKEETDEQNQTTEHARIILP